MPEETIQPQVETIQPKVETITTEAPSAPDSHAFKQVNFNKQSRKHPKLASAMGIGTPKDTTVNEVSEQGTPEVGGQEGFSNTDQANQSTHESEPSGVKEGKQNVPESIPKYRFDEVNTKYQEYKAKLEEYQAFDPVLQYFKDQGYTNSEAIEQATIEAQSQAILQEGQTNLQQYQANLQDRINNLELSVDDATELLNARALQIQHKAQSVQQQYTTQVTQTKTTKQSLEEARKELPHMTPEMELMLQAINPSSIPQAVKAWKEWENKIVEAKKGDIIAEYNAKKAKTADTPIPETPSHNFDSRGAQIPIEDRFKAFRKNTGGFTQALKRASHK